MEVNQAIEESHIQHQNEKEFLNYTAANLSRDAYQQNRVGHGNFRYVAELSDRHNAVYVNDTTKQGFLTIRGTAADVEDAKADALIVVGMENSSNRFKSAENTLLRAQKQFGDITFFATGHSLGGRIAIELGRKYRKGIEHVYAFNPGSSLPHFARSLYEHLNPYARNYGLSTKVTINHIVGDPLSTLSVGEAKDTRVRETSKPSFGLSQHGIKHFTDKKALNQQKTWGKYLLGKGALYAKKMIAKKLNINPQYQSKIEQAVRKGIKKRIGRK